MQRDYFFTFSNPVTLTASDILAVNTEHECHGVSTRCNSLQMTMLNVTNYNLALKGRYLFALRPTSTLKCWVKIGRPPFNSVE
ncbi:hypothetical protein BgiBS90_021969 [Biomphalaria glabrata]|nr:hypothetical protein BgiBS90_021969 [Biomphalaria glabrata]